MHRPTRLRLLGCSVAAGVLLLTGSACGEDELDRSEFISQVTDKQGGLDRPLANCVYDAMRRDDELLADLRDHGGWSDEISVDSDEKMQRIMARCILAEDEGGSASTTTTTEG